MSVGATIPEPEFVTRFVEGRIAFMVGVAADRPTASAGNVGWVYFATNTDGGTLYQCQFAPGSGYSWVKIAGSVSPPSTSAPAYVSVPATSTSSGSPGQVSYDSEYWYWCYSVDTWSRARRDLAVW